MYSYRFHASSGRWKSWLIVAVDSVKYTVVGVLLLYVSIKYTFNIIFVLGINELCDLIRACVLVTMTGERNNKAVAAGDRNEIFDSLTRWLTRSTNVKFPICIYFIYTITMFTSRDIRNYSLNYLNFRKVYNNYCR